MKKKILIVDDEMDFLMMMRSRLTAHDYEVTTAEDGVEAQHLIREDRPDLIILDVMMPKLDGFQLCRILKYDDHSKDIPVILVSARTHKSDMETGEEVHADAYITKPIPTEKLLETMESLLNKE